MISDLPIDDQKTPKKEPSPEWKREHKIFLDDDDIAIINAMIEEEEKKSKSIKN